MSSLNTLTGRLGKLSVGGALVARTTQWAVAPKHASTSEWGDSDSGGFTNRARGRKDCTFSCEGKYDTENDPFTNFKFILFAPDDVVAASLYVTGGPTWTFPRALCLDFSMSVNIDTEEVLGWSANFGADGIFSVTGI